MVFAPPANCVGWFKSDVGLYQSGTRASPGTPCASLNDPVGLWLDQSGSQNDLTAAGTKPLYTTNAFSSAALPGVNFTSRGILSTGSSFFSTAFDTAFTYFYVESSNPNATQNIVALSCAGGTSNWYDAKNGNGYQVGNVTPHLSINQSWSPNPALWGAGVHHYTYNGSTSIYGYENYRGAFSIYNNAGLACTGTLGATGALNVGGLSTGGNLFAGNIGEILMFNRALTGPETQYVLDYLSRWKTNYTMNPRAIIVGNSLSSGTGTTKGVLQAWNPVGGTVSPPLKAPTINPTGGGSTGGSLAAGTYFAVFTYLNLKGETIGSPESAQFTVAAGNIPTVTLTNGLPAYASSMNLYLTAANGSSGTEVLYATGITTGTTNCSAAASGSTAVPTTNTAVGQSLPAKVAALLNSPNGPLSPWAVYQDAYPGRKTTQMLTEYPVNTIFPFAPSTGQPQVAVVWEITNDLAFNNNGPTNIYNNMATLCRGLRASGANYIIVLTCNPRNDSPPVNFEADRQTINANIRKYGLSFADLVIDATSALHFQSVADTLNTAVFNADEVHCIDAGYDLLAPLITSGILSVVSRATKNFTPALNGGVNG